MRVIGLVFLVPQVVDLQLPYSFAGPAASGDLIAASLALISAIGLRANAPRALTLSATWFIPTVYVPALLVTHALIFVLLISRRARAIPPQSLPVLRCARRDNR
jgi:hypothetical protein